LRQTDTASVVDLIVNQGAAKVVTGVGLTDVEAGDSTRGERQRHHEHDEDSLGSRAMCIHVRSSNAFGEAISIADGRTLAARSYRNLSGTRTVVCTISTPLDQRQFIDANSFVLRIRRGLTSASGLERLAGLDIRKESPATIAVLNFIRRILK
jgi:hypothetical protein